MSVDWILFILLGLTAVGSALGLLLSSNAIHSALFLVLNFATVAVFFLMLGAPFIALMQITVYAGAIMVLFLFVIMLLGAEVLRQTDSALPWQRPLMLSLGALFLLAVGLMLFGGGLSGPASAIADLPKEFGGPQDIGLTLFRKYLLPFELTSFLLLLGMIGAVVLTREDKKKKDSNPKIQDSI
jgi:NADH-quinone oxidoreductase subunit J